jgi:hypothetical protein
MHYGLHLQFSWHNSLQAGPSQQEKNPSKFFLMFVRIFIPFFVFFQTLLKVDVNLWQTLLQETNWHLNHSKDQNPSVIGKNK